jgi:uncharacterized protein
MKKTSPSVFKVLLGFVILFTAYQIPVAVLHYLRKTELFLLLLVVFMAVAWLVARWQGFSGLKAYGLTNLLKSPKHLLAGLIIGLLFFSAAFLLAVQYDIVRINYLPEPKIFWKQALLFALVTLLPVIAFDILSMGYLYRFLHRRTSPETFIIFSAIVSTGNQIYDFESGLTTLAYLFLLGIMLVSPLVMTGNLWYTIGVHWAVSIVFRLTNDVLIIENGNNPIPSQWIVIAIIIILIPVNHFFINQLSLKKHRIS